MKTRGNVANRFRTMALRPEIFTTMIAHFEANLTTAAPPTKLKELVIVRTPHAHRCEYWLGSHAQIAQKLAWSKRQLDDLAITNSASFNNVWQLEPTRPGEGAE